MNYSKGNTVFFRRKLAMVQAALGRVMTAMGISLDTLHLYLAPNVRCVAFMGKTEGSRIY